MSFGYGCDCVAGGWASSRLGTNMPARAERMMRRRDCELELVGEPTGELYEVVMIVGIIEILQDYGISNKILISYLSWPSNNADKHESEIDSNTILNALDLNFIFRLQKSWYQEFIRQIDKDCEFLEQERIMDYSLLVGIHFREASVAGELIPYGARMPIGESEEEACPRLSRAGVNELLSDPSRWASIRLGTNMPARAERMMRSNDCELQLVGEPTGEFYEVVMIFGIIDILQYYDISKKLEHAYKSIPYDHSSISVVDPR